MSSSDEIRDDDFSELTRWKVDELGAHKYLEDVQDDLYSYMIEPIQNAMDSNDEGEPNIVSISTKSDPIIVQDEGKKGITKDYEGDVNRFLQAQKATTEKGKRGLERKGIGMFQYPKIAPKIIITSMDGELIHRIPITKDSEGGTCFGRVLTKAANDKNMEEFKIWKPGTRVCFFNRPIDAEKIIDRTLRKKIRDRFALRLARNKDLEVFVDEKKVVPPDWIIQHPPKFLFRLKGGHDVYGNIWHDPKGNGNIGMFQNGYLVEDIVWEPRQYLAYLECSALKTNTSRNAFIKRSNELWKDLEEKIKRLIQPYPRISQTGQDEKETRRMEDLIAQKMGDLLKKSTTTVGSFAASAKILTRGNIDGTGVIGYGVTDELPDPNRVIIERVYKGRDINNVSQVEVDEQNGKDKIKVQDKRIKKKRKETTPMDYIEIELRGDRPLLNYFPDHTPPKMYANILNEEYPYYKSVRQQQNAKLINQYLDILIAEIRVNIRTGMMPDPLRMELSRERVKIWKASKVYPSTKTQNTSAIEVKITNE